MNLLEPAKRGDGVKPGVKRSEAQETGNYKQIARGAGDSQLASNFCSA
jgi:hypothetical protein